MFLTRSGYPLFLKLISNNVLRLTFLGTGTSNGVPVLGCNCEVCTSADVRNKRFRAAAMIENSTTRILIDCGPDIRMQLLRVPFRKINGILLTHEHYDHIGGIDDLRPYCKFGDIDIYANAATVSAVRRCFPYCFAEHLYPGVPKLSLHAIAKHDDLKIGDIAVKPIEVMHDRLPILGYRFGSTAYITDMKSIAIEEMAYLQGVDTLIINALRWKDAHHSHLIVPEAINFARKIGAKRTFLTHLTHRIGLHDKAENRLPPDIHFAYDGMSLEL